MKILQMMAGGEHGGAETAFVDMCIAMHEAGQQIEVITRANTIRVPKLQDAGIKVHTEIFGGKMDIMTKRRIRKVIHHFQPHIVQTWMSRASAHAPPWSPHLKVPRYLNVARLGGPYKLKYFRSSDYFVTITLELREYLIEKGVHPDHVRHINNFAEVEEPKGTIAREGYDTPRSAPLLLGLGRLHSDKAFDTLIKAVAGLENVYLWIAGEGPAREELEALIKELNVGTRVRLLGWQEDRAALFNACDICTFISRDEPFGTVFVQSWAQKTPVIVSDADGPRQFVRDAEDGLIVPRDDVEALQGAIKRLINNKDLQSRLVENGFERYISEFTKEKSVENYLDFYQHLRTR